MYVSKGQIIWIITR